MRNVILLASAAAAAAVAAACGGSGGNNGEAVKSSASPTPMWLDRFPAYPNATSICHEHVAGTRGHIDWSSYASADDADTIASFVANKMDRLPPSRAIAIGDYRFDVHAVDDPDYPRCETTPPAGTKTVIIVSQMIR